MSKIVAIKDIGVPVPTDPAQAPAAGDQLVCYYGPKGFTPSYSQPARVALPLAGLSQATVNSVVYYDFPASAIPAANLADGENDFVFTLLDASGSEGDFSPAVTETVDRTAPFVLGQPIVLT